MEKALEILVKKLIKIEMIDLGKTTVINGRELFIIHMYLRWSLDTWLIYINSFVSNLPCFQAGLALCQQTRGLFQFRHGKVAL